MKVIDINDVDKKHFKCFKFDDESYYYGEIAYLDEFNNIICKEEHTEEMLKSLKLVRHGIGVQIYGMSEDHCDSRYEGSWSKDKKTGQGIFHYADDSSYEGMFLNEQYEGFGKFQWSNGDIYIGEWKNGKMEGEGEFRHNDGHSLKGKFANNYYFDKERFVNPFISIDDLEVFRTKNMEYFAKIQVELEKFSRANIMKVSNQQELIANIESTIQSNKTPIILRSSSCMLKKTDLLKLVIREYREFDLRYFSLKLRENLNNPNDVFSEIKKIVEESISKGTYLVLNFDDCTIRYDDLFDPDIKEFYGNSMLSSFMWTPNLFSQQKCWHNHLGLKQDAKYDKNFKFIVYSRFVIDSTLQEHDLINVIEKRFEKSFPLTHMNILILSQ